VESCINLLALYTDMLICLRVLVSNEFRKQRHDQFAKYVTAFKPILQIWPPDDGCLSTMYVIIVGINHRPIFALQVVSLCALFF